jgi:hypothetical protein
MTLHLHFILKIGSLEIKLPAQPSLKIFKNSGSEPKFLNIQRRLKVDFSRRAVFSKVRVYNRAHSG